MFNELPSLGVGLGYRPQFKTDVFLNRSQIDLLEITTDHYIDAGTEKLDELKLLADHFSLIPHSLELSLGSAEGLDREYVAKLRDVVSVVNPPWFSDHICFTRSGGVKIGHLAPVPFTEEALGVFAKNIADLKKSIDVPLILENITYNVEYPMSRMSEAEFLTRLLNETDCGLLLDVANLYINAKNLGYDWRESLDHLPLDRLVQIHFVGWHESGKRLIDAHADATQEEIWNVFREVCVRSNVKGAILERDENFPAFRDLLGELATARDILRAENYVLP